MAAVFLFLLLSVRVERYFVVIRWKKNREKMNSISHTRASVVRDLLIVDYIGFHNNFFFQFNFTRIEIFF